MTYVHRNLEEAGKAEKISLQFEDAQGDDVRQLNQVQSFLAQNVDAVIVRPGNTAMALQQAGMGKGQVPVVGVDGLPDGQAAVRADHARQPGGLHRSFQVATGSAPA
nr:MULTISPECIES: hypothetical protein [unclassified Pseudomonas]